jgi:hypothetical protein
MWWDNHGSVESYVELGMDLGIGEPNRRSAREHGHRARNRGCGIGGQSLMSRWGFSTYFQ